jgi:signal transduction histidine kinase
VRLFHKIALLLVAASALPLATVGFAVVAANQRALEAEVRARFDQTARHAAEAIAADVEGRARQLAQTASLIGWDKLSAEEATGALELMRRQTRASAAGLFDARDQLRTRTGEGPIPDAPIDRARKEGAGAVVFAPPKDGLLVGAMSAGTQVITLAIPLQPTARRLDEVRGDLPCGLFLVDDRGKLIVKSTAAQESKPTAALTDSFLKEQPGQSRRIAESDRVTVGGFAPVGGLGWAVLIEEDAASAFAAPRRMRLVTLATTGAAALGAIALAFLLAGRLSRALEKLASAARSLQKGQLSARVPASESGDEIGELGRTFNQMGEALEASRAEIEKWNKELEARVVERTKELKEAQAQLVQAQKLAALGQLGAGVAHEINNPLGGVIGHVQLLLADHGPGDKDHEALAHIEEGARRASQVVQNLLRFSVQHKEPVRSAVDVNKLIKDTLSLTSTLLVDQKITLDMQLDGTVPRLRADAGQLAQVLLNLVSNARTAMPQGGKLSVRTAKSDGKVALAVADTGRGIDPTIRERIFEPFFTTKDEWSNVGLGLSVSWRIVDEHGGKIDVESEPGRGSTFTVWLPAA